MTAHPLQIPCSSAGPTAPPAAGRAVPGPSRRGAPLAPPAAAGGGGPSHGTALDFLGTLRWLDGTPLLGYVEPYRRAIFEALLDTAGGGGRAPPPPGGARGCPPGPGTRSRPGTTSTWRRSCSRPTRTWRPASPCARRSWCGRTGAGAAPSSPPRTRPGG